MAATPMSYEDVSAVIKTLVQETFDRNPHTPRQHANIQLNALSALIPLYDGNTKPGVCRGWMNKMEMVFTLVHLDDEETNKYKVSYASLRLKGGGMVQPQKEATDLGLLEEVQGGPH